MDSDLIYVSGITNSECLVRYLSMLVMTLQQFKFLGEEAQEMYLRRNAVLVGTAYEKHGIYTLFQIEGFYLEVLTSDNETRITSLEFFEDTAMLSPYLESINISNIYEILNSR